MPAPHSLGTANFGAVGPMCQIGGSCVCRAVLWLGIGLNTVQWTDGACLGCLAAAGLTYCEFECRLALYGAPTALGVCIEHCRRCVSGGFRSQNRTCSLYQCYSTFYGMCTARAEAMVAIGEAAVHE